MPTIWNLSSLIVLGLATLVAAADDGDDFSNNLLSDLAPLLALFGERVTMQFMSQSMGWADNVILAMAPLGIITALVSAIRVGGPQWLKAIVGRARENLAAAEVELMSSTSGEVCELWNGQQLVRCMGKSTVTEFICLLQTAEKTANMVNQEQNQEHMVEIDPLAFQIKPRGKNTAEKDPEADLQQAQQESSSQSKPLSHRIIFLRNKSDTSPNISLNSHRQVTRWEQFTRWEPYIVALFGTVLQLAVLVYSGVVTYHLKFPKAGAAIAKYAFPCNILGTVFLVTGILLCGYVVESITEEKSYEAKLKGTETRILWLQQPQTVNDQDFKSFAIWARDRKYITKSKRNGAGSEGSQDNHFSTVFESFSIELQGDSTVAIQSSQGHQIIQHSQKSANPTSTNTHLKKMSVFGAAITLYGFILQFIGLRGLHWSSSVFQLGAVLVMTGLRAWVRRGLVEKLGSESLEAQFELEWFALSLRKPGRLFSSPIIAQETPSDSGEEDCKDWRVVTGSPPGHYQTLKEMKTQESPPIHMKSGTLDAYGVMEIRRQLGVLAGWRGPASMMAESLKKAIETTMDTLFVSNSSSKLVWSLEVCRGLDVQPIFFEIEKLEGKWKVDSADIDAALSLWLYSASDKDKKTHPKPKYQSSRRRGPYKYYSPLDGNEPSAKQNLQILGPCTDSLDQALQWWLPADAARIVHLTEAGEDTSHEIRVEAHRVVGCGGKQENVSKRRDAPRLFNESKHDEAAFDSQASLLAIESICPLEVLYSQQMFSAFMWAVAKTLKCPIDGGVTIQPIGIESGQDDWKSFTLRNDKLHKMVQDICNTGLGNLVEIYLAVVPPLSAENKLPRLDKIVDLAKEKAKPYEQARHWDSAADIYQWLLRMVTTSSQEHYAACRATAMLMEYLDRVTRNIELRQAQQYRDQDVQPLEGVQAKLKETLQTVDQGVKEQLQAYKQKARDRAVGILQRRIVTSTADVEEEDIYDWTILHYATTQEWNFWKFWGIEQRWDEFKFDINAQDLQGRTALHYACIDGKNDIVKALLRRGAKGDTPCMDGRSPFHYAVNNCDISVVKSFVEAGTSIDVRDSLGQTPLFLAAFKGNVKVVENLWPDVNQRLRDDQGRVALHLASMGGNIDVVKWLIEEAKVDQDVKDGSGRTSLHLAVTQGHEHILRYLVQDAKVDKEARDDADLTALHMAADSGQETIVRYLVKTAKVDKEARINEGEGSLDIPKGLGHKGLVQYLIEDAKVKPETKDKSGWTALHEAVNSGNEVDVRRLFYTARRDKLARNEYSCTALHMAACSGHEAVVRYFIEDAKVHKEARDNDGDTALHWAAHRGHVAVVRYLVEAARVDKEAKSKMGSTALHMAALSGHEAVVRYLVETAEVDKEARDNDGDTVLHNAAYSGHEAVVRYLVETAEVDKEARDNDGDTALNHAAYSGHEAVVRYLVETAEVDKEARDNDGDTVLHNAAYSGHEAVVRYLVETAEVDKEARDNDGDTALNHAAYSGHEAVVRYLVEAAEVDKEAKSNDGDTVLHNAAYSGNEAVVRYLVETAEVDKEARRNDGQTALHLAAFLGHEAVVRYLVGNAGVDQNSQDGLNETALHKAAKSGYTTIVHYLQDEAIVDRSIRSTSDQMASQIEVKGGTM